MSVNAVSFGLNFVFHLYIYIYIHIHIFNIVTPWAQGDDVDKMYHVW